MACNLMEYYECKWMLATECPEEQVRQTRQNAPKGCCVEPAEGAEYPFVAPLFGSDSNFEDDVPQVDCGGGVFAAEDDNSVFYAPKVDDNGEEVVQTCELVQADMAAQVAAYEAELAAAAGTTTAAARV